MLLKFLKNYNRPNSSNSSRRRKMLNTPRLGELRNVLSTGNTISNKQPKVDRIKNTEPKRHLRLSKHPACKRFKLLQ